MSASYVVIARPWEQGWELHISVVEPESVPILRHVGVTQCEAWEERFRTVDEYLEVDGQPAGYVRVILSEDLKGGA